MHTSPHVAVGCSIITELKPSLCQEKSRPAAEAMKTDPFTFSVRTNTREWKMDGDHFMKRWGTRWTTRFGEDWILTSIECKDDEVTESWRRAEPAESVQKKPSPKVKKATPPRFLKKPAQRAAETEKKPKAVTKAKAAMKKAEKIQKGK
eukprot:s106_g23.t1